VKRLTGLTFSIIIFLTYFVIATKGRIYTIFTMFFPEFHIILLISVLFFGIIYAFFPKTEVKDDNRLVKSLFFIIPFSVFAFSLFINLFFIIAPVPDDGIHYVWLSKLILNGKLYLETPDFYEHYYSNFLFNHNGNYVSIFLPGFSFFMTPFTFFGIEFCFNPVIAGINTYLAGIHAVKLKDRSAGIVVMLMFGFSSVHLLHGGFYFPHHFGLMLVLIAVYLIVHRAEKRSSFIIAGALLSIMLFIKPQNALYTYFAGAVYIIFKERSVKNAVLFTFPFLVTGSALMLYNYHLTGNPFVFAQDVYFNALDLREFCHRPGFGKGCAGNHGETLPPEGVTFVYATGVTFLRLNNFLHRITAHPAILLFIIPVIFKKPYKYFLYYFMPLCAIFAYFTFYIEGNFVGPRYLLESGALFVIAAGCGFSEIYCFFRNRKGIRNQFSAGSFAGIFASTLIFFAFFVMPQMLVKTDTPDNLKKVKTLIEKEEIENSIILLPHSFGFHFHSILSVQDNPPHDKYGNLIIYSLGELLDSNIQKFYKDSKYDKIVKVNKNANNFSIMEIPFLEDDGKYHAEFEMKFIPLKGKPKFILGFYHIHQAQTFEFNPTPDVEFSYGAQGVLFDSQEEFYEFEHSVKTSGNYKIDIVVVETGCTVKFSVLVNGLQKTEFIPEKGEISLKKITFTSQLNAGKNTVRIIPHNEGCLILDYMDVSRSP